MTALLVTCECFIQVYDDQSECEILLEKRVDQKSFNDDNTKESSIYDIEM